MEERERAFVAEFTRILDEGFRPDPEEYVNRLPEESRDVVRARIAEILAERASGSVAVAEREPVSAELQLLPPAEAEGGRGEGMPEIPGFRFDARIGRGTTGEVFLAFDESRGRRVAIKLLDAGLEGYEALVEGARASVSVEHPAAAVPFSVMEAEGSHALAMEFVEGLSLDRACAELDWRARARALLQVIGALAAAHRAGVVHGALRPRNVLMTASVEPKVLDFGLALPPATPEDAAFASPEQARGRKPLPASDVFSFGALMYAVLTGRAPFEGESVEEVLRQLATTDPPFPRALVDDVPLDLQAICLACMARLSTARPTAEAVAADLARWLEGEPARLKPAVFRDTLQRRAIERIGETEAWAAKGLVTPEERDKLVAVYRDLAAAGEDGLGRLSIFQALLAAGVALAVAGSALLVGYGRAAVPSWLLAAVPGAVWAALFGLGARAHLRADAPVAAVLLLGAVVAFAPAALALLAEAGVAAAPPGRATQLLEGTPYSNTQLLLASAASLAFSVVALVLLQHGLFAWTTALFAAGVYFAIALTQDFLGRAPAAKALFLLPLVLAEAAAFHAERAGRPRWAVPGHLLAFGGLLGALEILAAENAYLRPLGLAGAPSHLSFAVPGLLLLGAMIALERAPSLDLRRGARLLQALAPAHLLVPLYLFARSEDTPLAPLPLAGASLLLLALAPWRDRRRLLAFGLAGLVAAAHAAVA
jgi:hypothetical protein